MWLCADVSGRKFSRNLRINMPVEWTEEQEKILKHELDGDAGILAGPGTGKSTTVVERVGRLLRKNLELKIKLLAFTCAATAELVKKLETHPTGKRLKPSTLHPITSSRKPACQDRRTD